MLPEGLRRKRVFRKVSAGPPESVGQQIPTQGLDGKSQKIGTKLKKVAQYWRDLGILDAEVEAGEKKLISTAGRAGDRASPSSLRNCSV